MIDTRIFETGERPQPGQPVLVLLAGSQVHAEVYVPEAIRARVRPGVAARVFVDGLDEPIDGTVRWVASECAYPPY